VRSLLTKSVPADSIRVFVEDDAGRGRQEVAVEAEAGALEGALIAAGVGAVVGLLIVIFLMARYGSTGSDLLGVSSILGSLRAIATCAVVGVPIGAVLGMGRWKGKRRIAEASVSPARIEVVVESEELAPLAESVFEAAGAEGVERRRAARDAFPPRIP
jgi:hypothetical protein